MADDASPSEVVSFLAARPGVEVIETHLSWVFRSETEVLKLKKAVRLTGQDLRTVDARRRNCETEDFLNRRFSPDVYLGVLPVCRRADQSLQVGAPGAPIDWLVRMRRLPDDRFLDRRIAAGDVDHALLRRALLPVVRHHARSPPALMDPGAYVAGLGAVLDSVERDLDVPAVDPGRRAAILAALRGWLASHAEVLGRRVAERRIVEGHGDLRPEHVCLTPAPAVIDCLEFDRSLRTLDGLDDLGFLALECEQLGARDVAATVMEVWRTESGDAYPSALLAFYQSVRAVRRASVAALRLSERERSGSGARALLLARVDRNLTAAEARARGLEQA